jgi:hypothetical protein
MVTDFSEKRKSQRVEVELPVIGKCMDPKGRSHAFKGETRNMSFGGLCVKISSPNGFRAGQDINFKTRLYQGDFSIKGNGEVCWVQKLEDPNWPLLMGIQLKKMRRYGLWVEKIEDRIVRAVKGTI